MATALVNGRVLLPDGFVDGRAIVLDAGRIAAVVEEADLQPGTERHDLGGGLLVPGFIDTQVNGGGGVLFNDAPTADTIRAIGRADPRCRTTLANRSTAGCSRRPGLRPSRTDPCSSACHRRHRVRLRRPRR